MKQLVTSALLVAALCVPVSALARQQDFVGQAVTITLANGSKVSGTVTKHEGGKVSLKADLIGDDRDRTGVDSRLCKVRTMGVEPWQRSVEVARMNLARIMGDSGDDRVGFPVCDNGQFE